MVCNLMFVISTLLNVTVNVTTCLVHYLSMIDMSKVSFCILAV